MRSVVLVIAAFAVMEPVTAATHRFVMHGPGLVLHRSHHRRTHRGWERNDAYPVMFAALVCVGLWLGFHAPHLAELVPIGVGVTAYGAAYARGPRRVHPSPAALVRRTPGAAASNGSPPPTSCTTASAGPRTGCSCRSSRAGCAPARRHASGSRPSHVPEAP